MRRDRRVALSILDPENPYRYLEIRGTVTDITEEGAAEHIDKMAKKYLVWTSTRTASRAKCGLCTRSGQSGSARWGSRSTGRGKTEVGCIRVVVRLHATRPVEASILPMPPA